MDEDYLRAQEEEINMAFVPSEHERVFELIPIGVNYVCEFCHEGNMIVDTNETLIVELTDPPRMALRTHICDKCQNTMKLPKTYPYVEWLTKAEYAEMIKKDIL